MLRKEWDLSTALEVWREEGLEEGREMGREEILAEILRLINKGCSTTDIVREYSSQTHD